MRQIVRHMATIAKDGTVTLPEEVRRLLGVEEGGTAVFEVTGNDIRLGSEEMSNPFLRYRGIWRDGEGLTSEQILEEIREMRGWDDYERNLPEDDDHRG